MNTMHLKTLAPLFLFFHFCTAHAQQTTSTESTEVVESAKSSDEKKAEVVISGMKNPEIKPYRILSAGMRVLTIIAIGTINVLCLHDGLGAMVGV
jgi:hypothetical protein